MFILYHIYREMLKRLFVFKQTNSYSCCTPCVYFIFTNLSIGFVVDNEQAHLSFSDEFLE